MADTRTTLVHELDSILHRSKRRDFLKLAALGGMGIFLPPFMSGCGAADLVTPGAEADLHLGSAAGPLNVVNLYGQFMADFYSRFTSRTFVYGGEAAGTQVVGMTLAERTDYGSILDQKNATWASLRKLMPQEQTITKAVLFNWETVDFTNGDVLRSLAITFEDLGIAAVNGLMINDVSNPTDLTLLGQIATNWARHAALVHALNDIHANGVTGARLGFAATVDPQGLDAYVGSSAVISAVKPYLVTQLTASA